jgi:hypothetical protein
MEEPCYKCGQPVEQGVRFCPHCVAPQIRVVVADPPPSTTEIAPSSNTAAIPASDSVPVLAVPMHWSQALKPCALAALVVSFLMSLGLNPFVAMFSVGFLAVIFHRQSRAAIAIKAALGARLGALSGLLWFAMSAILETLVVLIFHKGPEIRQQLLTAIDQAASRTTDPQVLAEMNRLKTPEGLEVLMILGLLLAFFAAIVLSALGGALGASILGRKNRP